MKKLFMLFGSLLFVGFWLASAHLDDIIQLHLKYANFGSSVSLKKEALVIEEKTSDLWDLFSQSKDFQKIDIVQLLDADQREKNLEQYLSNGDHLLAGLNFQQSSLASELQKIQNQSILCQNTLSSANDLFVISLQNIHEEGFYRAVEQAKSARVCLWEQGVMERAIQTLIAQVKSNQNAITPRITYLKNNKELIIKHYDILKPSLLAELYKISVMLERK